MRIGTDALVAARVPAAPPRGADFVSSLLALAIGMTFTFCVYGYQFGRSNHTIYLLDAMRQADPSLLINDWFVTHTLQYHAVFGWMTALFNRTVGIETPFLIEYVGLVALFHVAWMAIVASLGGTRKAYLVSVLLYYLSAGGTSLGVYQFFQDSSLLASNIANVLLLVGIAWWVRDRPILAGFGFGLAGLFHLNHALFGSGLWLALIAWRAWDHRKQNPLKLLLGRQMLVATLLAVVPSAINVGLALGAKIGRDAGMPLEDFIYTYVYFRHPHHYAPRKWPIALYVAFAWAIVPALIYVYANRSRLEMPTMTYARAQATRICVITCAVLGFALIFAGFRYVSATLVQMSLFRFGPYVQVIACTFTAILIVDQVLKNRFAGQAVVWATLAGALFVAPLLFHIGPREGDTVVAGMRPFSNVINADRAHGGLILFAILSLAPLIHDALNQWTRGTPRIALHLFTTAALAVAVILGWNRWIGVIMQPDRESADYVALAQWARDNTPKDAIFLVPPAESVWRLEARRAIVVNFKGVPQLAGELREWRDRLLKSIDVHDIRTLPTGLGAAQPEIERRYAMLDAPPLIAAAEAYHAEYIVTPRMLTDPHLALARTSPGGSFRLYKLTP